jgi:hypothetical protein
MRLHTGPCRRRARRPGGRARGRPHGAGIAAGVSLARRGGGVLDDQAAGITGAGTVGGAGRARRGAWRPRRRAARGKSARLAAAAWPTGGPRGPWRGRRGGLFPHLGRLFPCLFPHLGRLFPHVPGASTSGVFPVFPCFPHLESRYVGAREREAWRARALSPGARLWIVGPARVARGGLCPRVFPHVEHLSPLWGSWGRGRDRPGRRRRAGRPGGHARAGPAAVEGRRGP